MRVLRPETVRDETVMTGTAFWRVRMSVAKLRRPGHRQYVIVEYAGLPLLVLILRLLGVSPMAACRGKRGAAQHHN